MPLPSTVWRWVLWGLCLPFSILLAACSSYTPPEHPTTIRIGICTSLRPLLDEVYENYLEAHEDLSLEVLEGSERYILRKLQAKEVDVALITAKDIPGARLIARDGLAIIVHPSNPVESLSLEELRAIYAGYIWDWGEIGGEGEIVLVSRENGSGARAFFEERVMGGIRVSPVAVVMPSSQDVLEYISLNPKAIGYVSMGYLTEKVKALKLGGFQPSPSAVRTGKYPLSRPVYAVAINETGHSLVDFLTGPVGKNAIGRRYGLP
ncbi:MAG: hypothetical protein DRI61_09505 [Chloroflexi bacterium]|nr:MAG: hypothetical protein DRI61_09505 [Chloroflexota bacterium]